MYVTYTHSFSHIRVCVCVSRVSQSMTVFIAPPRFGVLCSPGSPWNRGGGLASSAHERLLQRLAAAIAQRGQERQSCPVLRPLHRVPSTPPWSWLCPSTNSAPTWPLPSNRPNRPPADTYEGAGESVWGRSCRWICGRVTRAGGYVAELHYKIHTGQWTNCSRTSGGKVREREKKEMRGAEALAVAVCVPW